MINNTIEYNQHAYKVEEKRNLNLSLFNIFLIFVCTTAYFLYGQLLVPIFILLLLPIFIFLGVYSAKKGSVALLVFILTATLIELKDSEHGTFTIYVGLAGAVISWVMFSWLIKKILTREKYSTNSNEYFFIELYFIWIIIVGLENLFLRTTFSSWYRDILVICPLLVIPPLFVHIDLRNKYDKTIFYATMLITWMICFITSIVKIRSSFLASSYLFEVSYSPINIIAAPFMTFVFFNLFLIEKKKKNEYYWILGMIISVIAIFLTHNRTMWVLTPFGLFLAPFFLPKNQRKKSYRLYLRLFFVFLAIIGFIYLSSPFARILVKAYFSYFLTVSNLRTDESLIGRYVEWRYVVKAIKDSPFVGSGFGGSYHLYNWWGGWFYEAVYTHNGYLGVLLKGGIVGFVLLFGAYFGFLWKGFNLLRKRILSEMERAFIRTGITILLLLLIATNTLNIFAHRDILLYVGVIWGYFIYLGRNTALLIE